MSSRCGRPQHSDLKHRITKALRGPKSGRRREKALEEEYPGIGFRDSIGGREAYVRGHRVAIWEVLAAYEEAKTVVKTAQHFRWPPAVVRSALAFAKAFKKNMPFGAVPRLVPALETSVDPTVFQRIRAIRGRL